MPTATPVGEWGSLVYMRVALDTVRATAMFGQVLVFSLLFGLLIALTRQRTELIATSVPFLVAALVGDLLSSSQLGWFCLLLWILCQAVYRVPATIGRLFR